MTDDSQPRYFRERLLFAAALIAGLLLLYLSTKEALGKFPSKLSEALGTAFILACVMDVFFRMLVRKVRSRDREAEDEAIELLRDRARRRSQNEAERTSEMYERVARSLEACETRLNHIDRALDQLAK